MWKWFTRVVIAAAVLLVLFKAADWAARRSGPLPVPPSPNGYDALLAIADKVRRPPGNLGELSPEQLRELGLANRAAFEELQETLRSPTGVPLRVESGWSDRHAEELKKLKTLAVVLAAQSRFHTVEGRTNDAARCLMDITLLGQAIPRGGLLSDGLNGLAVETIGAASLRALAPSLEADACRRLARELEEAEHRRESPERILDTERRWSAASFGLVSRVGGWLLGKSHVRRQAEFTARYHETTRRTRRLMLVLAVRAVQLETGRSVGGPSDLVPGVLGAVPVDPVSGAPFAELRGAANEP